MDGFGVGYSGAPDAVIAAHESVEQALGGRTPARDDLMLVFATVGGASLELDPEKVFVAAQFAAGNAHVVGCSSYASFTDTAQLRPGVVAAWLPAHDTHFGVAAVDRISDDIYAAARQAAGRAWERAGRPRDHSVLLMLSDGLAGDLREVVRGSYSVTGATVPLVGGAAGEDLRLSTTYQYVDGQLMTNGLVAVWVSSRQPLGVGVAHGWHPVGEPMLVTRADGNVVSELDGVPAADAYLTDHGHRPRDDANLAVAVMDRPLGLATVSGQFELRHILNRTDDGELVMFGHVSEQSVVQVMAAGWNDLVAGAGRAADDATGQLAQPPRGGLAFSCTGRVAPLGDRVADEAAEVARRLEGAPVAGFFTYGEFARVNGSTGFHNGTVAVLTW